MYERLQAVLLMLSALLTILQPLHPPPHPLHMIQVQSCLLWRWLCVNACVLLFPAAFDVLSQVLVEHPGTRGEPRGSAAPAMLIRLTCWTDEHCNVRWKSEKVQRGAEVKVWVEGSFEIKRHEEFPNLNQLVPCLDLNKSYQSLLEHKTSFFRAWSNTDRVRQDRMHLTRGQSCEPIRLESCNGVGTRGFLDLHPRLTGEKYNIYNVISPRAAESKDLSHQVPIKLPLW